MNNYFRDKTIVITGAGGVLCAGFAEKLAECGAKIALLDINESAANDVADKICNLGYVAKAYKADVLDRASLENVRELVSKDFGLCDILINGAGGNNPKATTAKEYFEEGDDITDAQSFFGLDKKGIGFVFDLNILGTVLPSQIFGADLASKKAGSILNISSMNAFTPLTKIPAYSAAKAGVSNFTQWLAVHLSKVNVRVNAIAPGFFVTNQNRALLFGQDGVPTARAGKILAATPMGRFGEAEELNGALMFLLDETKSGFISGVILPVDGGFSAYSGV